MDKKSEPVIRRFSLLKRNPQHTRAGFSDHYENFHGPLAAGLAGFRRFATRYVQNHVVADESSETRFDGVTMTTQVPRENYSEGFFTDPDYEHVKDDEQYLFDIEKTVSLLGREEIKTDGPTTGYKTLFLVAEDQIPPTDWQGATRLVYNYLNTQTASALGFAKGSFDYRLLVEAWYPTPAVQADAVERATSSSQTPRPIGLPVREIEVFSPARPWARA